METNFYIKITLPGHDDGYITTEAEAKTIFQQMIQTVAEGNETDRFEVSVVEMTVDEFLKIPPFQGF